MNLVSNLQEARIRSVIDTAVKNNQNPVEIILLIVQCEVATVSLQKEKVIGINILWIT
jgi:hypothetical protein